MKFRLSPAKLQCLKNISLFVQPSPRLIFRQVVWKKSSSGSETEEFHLQQDLHLWNVVWCLIVLCSSVVLVRWSHKTQACRTVTWSQVSMHDDHMLSEFWSVKKMEERWMTKHAHSKHKLHKGCAVEFLSGRPLKNLQTAPSSMWYTVEEWADLGWLFFIHLPAHTV